MDNPHIKINRIRVEKEKNDHRKYIRPRCSSSAQVVLNLVDLLVDSARYAFESGRRRSDHLHQLRHVLSGYLTKSSQRFHTPKAMLLAGLAVEVL